MHRLISAPCRNIFSPSKEGICLLQAQICGHQLSRHYANIFPHGDYIHPNPLVQPLPTGKHFKSKHYNPKFRKERAAKVIKVELPDFHKKKEKDYTPAEQLVEMKKLGIQPHRPWDEKPLFISATSEVIDPYIPPEGDGKASGALSKEALKQKVGFLEKKRKSMMAVRKIRQYDDDFDHEDFANSALGIYIKLHEALVKMDEDELHRLATELAYPLVVNEVKYKTLRWSFHGSLEPPRVVHARELHIIDKENVFAQVTVRFHTQQILAVYDRFGRLIHGSESVLRDVLEYVVFEKQLANVYGLWRIHAKIIPSWMQLKPTSHYTFKLPSEKTQEEGLEVAAVAT